MNDRNTAEIPRKYRHTEKVENTIFDSLKTEITYHIFYWQQFDSIKTQKNVYIDIRYLYKILHNSLRKSLGPVFKKYI